MDDVNVDSDANSGTKPHEPCMRTQSWKRWFHPSDAHTRGWAQWFGHAQWAWSTGLNMEHRIGDRVTLLDLLHSQGRVTP